MRDVRGRRDVTFKGEEESRGTKIAQIEVSIYTNETINMTQREYSDNLSMRDKLNCRSTINEVAPDHLS